MIELNKNDVNIYNQIKTKNQGISFEELLLDNNIRSKELTKSLKKLKENDIIYYDGEIFKRRW